MSIEVPAGTVMSGYRVERLIGRGATGAVYLARDEHLDRAVALKVLAPELTRDQRFRERFLRESRVAAALDNPHIVPIYAAGESDGALFLAMRHVEGSDLGEIVAEAGRLDAQRTLAILIQIAEALDAAHGQDLIHRDVKPANILVAAGDRAYLCDFGLAKHAATINSLSRDTAFAGTIDYISPEQIRGADIDGRADIYALGCVLFECLTGRPPFDRDTDLAIVFAHLNEPPPSLSALRPDLPTEVDAAVNRALAKEPEDRFRTCGELVDGFRAAVGGETPAVVSAPAGSTQLRTFLIADVRGYTRYTQQYGDEAAAELASNFADLVRRVVTARDGRLIELRGDEALVVFESARQALRAGIEIQAAVAEAGLPRGVGIGLDAGEAVPVGKGYRGGALNMAARLCSLAQPGEVLASDGVMHMARSVDGIRYLEGRLERLKGIDHPVRVVEVVPHHRGDALIGRLRRRTHGRPWLTLWVPIAVMMAIVAVIATVMLGSGGGAAKPPGKLHAINVLDVKTGAYRGSAAVGFSAFSVRAAGKSIWAEGDGVIYKLNARTRRVQRTISLGNVNAMTTDAAGNLWVALGDEPAVARIDAQYASVRKFQLPAAGIDGDADLNGRSIAVGAGSLWVARQGQVIRIDPRSGKLQRPPIAVGVDPDILRFGDGAAYLASSGDGTITSIDAGSDRILWSTRLHPWLPDMLAAEGFLWVTVDSDAGVHKLDEHTGREISLVHTGAGPDALSYDGSSIWVDNWRAYTVTRIDPIGGATRSYRLAGNPTGPVAVDRGSVWVPTQGTAKDLTTAVTGKVVHLVQREDWTDDLDPAREWESKHWQLEYATEAKLFNYRDPDATHTGAELAPEISKGWPQVSDRGRTWTFTIDERFGFSPPSTQHVTAATVKFSIERALSGDWAPANQFLTNVIGEDAFLKGDAPHVSGIVASGDTLALHLTKPAPDLASILAMPFFAVVPMGTPSDGLDLEATPIPSAGPYYVQSSSNGWWRIVKRNPNYGGQRPRHLDAIVYETGIDTGPAAKRIERGTLDYASESYPDSGVFTPDGPISQRYGGQRQAGEPWYAQAPQPGIRYLEFNVNSGIFQNANWRRAINYAIDRPALAAVDGGVANDHYVPQAVPGVSKRHVYPITSPTSADLAKARALTGEHAATITLETCPRPVCAERAQILRDDLARIGVQLRLRIKDSLSDHDPNYDILDIGWYMDEIDPKNVLIYDLLNPDGIVHSVRWEARLAADDRLPIPQRYAAFGKDEIALMQTMAPWAVYEQPADPTFVSARTGCVEFSPVYAGVDLAALCLN